MQRRQVRENRNDERQQRREQPFKGHRNWSRREDRRKDSNLVEHEFVDSGEYRRKKAKHQRSGDIERLEKRRAVDPVSEESSGSSATEDRYRRKDIQVKTPDTDIGSPKNKSQKQQVRRSRQVEKESE